MVLSSAGWSFWVRNVALVQATANYSASSDPSRVDLGRVIVRAVEAFRQVV